jgi:hypothetical protein
MFISDWFFHIGRVGSVWVQWDPVYSHPDADFHADQDPYSYSDVHPHAYPYAPAYRVDSVAHQ